MWGTTSALTVKRNLKKKVINCVLFCVNRKTLNIKGQNDE